MGKRNQDTERRQKSFALPSDVKKLQNVAAQVIESVPDSWDEVNGQLYARGEALTHRGVAAKTGYRFEGGNRPFIVGEPEIPAKGVAIPDGDRFALIVGGRLPEFVHFNNSVGDSISSQIAISAGLIRLGFIGCVRFSFGDCLSLTAHLQQWGEEFPIDSPQYPPSIVLEWVGEEPPPDIERILEACKECRLKPAEAISLAA